MTTHSGPGKSYRKGMSLNQVVKRFDTEDKAEKWFIEQRWPNGLACPHCGGLNIAEIASRNPSVAGNAVSTSQSRREPCFTVPTSH